MKNVWTGTIAHYHRRMDRHFDMAVPRTTTK